MQAKLVDMVAVLSRQMRVLQALDEAAEGDDALNNRECLILELLDEHGKMSISEIGSFFPGVAPSTVSKDISRLWTQRKMVSKAIDPDNERTRIVELTPKGARVLRAMNTGRTERLTLLIGALELKRHEAEVLMEVVPRAAGTLEARIAKLRAEHAE